MNIEKILNALNLTDQDKIAKIHRIVDIANHVNKNHTVQSSDFMSPDLLGFMEPIFAHYRDLSYEICGGHNDFEYFKVVIYPDYLMEVDSPIAVVDLTYNTKYGLIGHRDILGAVMNLGIKREIIGDILAEPGHAQIMVDSKMSEYVLDSIRKIGRVTVEKKLVSLEDVIAIEAEFKHIDTTVKSIRLDAVVASGFNIPRSKAVDLIKNERVKVNHVFVCQTSKEIKENDLISVRGSGRIRLEEIFGLSKKERFRIRIKKYI